MKIENGKIIEATEDELFDYYLRREYDLIYAFPMYMMACKKNGTKIIKEKKHKEK